MFTMTKINEIKKPNPNNKPKLPTDYYTNKKIIVLESVKRETKENS